MIEILIEIEEVGQIRLSFEGDQFELFKNSSLFEELEKSTEPKSEKFLREIALQFNPRIFFDYE